MPLISPLAAPPPPPIPPGPPLSERARLLALHLAEAAAGHDAADAFVAESYPLLREAGLIEAGVPAELGGGGASLPALCDMLRMLGAACGSTALALAMHTHQVAVPAWRWRHQEASRALVEPILRRVAGERIVLMSSGGSDWIGGSGTAERVEGGWRIAARKAFASGAPAGTLLMTSAVAGDEVLHFAVPWTRPR